MTARREHAEGRFARTIDIGNWQTITVSGDEHGRGTVLIEWSRPWGNSRRVVSFGFRKPEAASFVDAVKRAAAGRPMEDGERRQVHVTVGLAGPFRCDEHDPPREFDSADALGEHIAGEHMGGGPEVTQGGHAIRCGVKGCPGNIARGLPPAGHTCAIGKGLLSS